MAKSGHAVRERITAVGIARGTPVGESACRNQRNDHALSDSQGRCVMGSNVEILWPSDTLRNPALPLHQEVHRMLVAATEEANAGPAARALLKQFEGNMLRLPDVQLVRTPASQTCKHCVTRCQLSQKKFQPVLCSAHGGSSSGQVLWGRPLILTVLGGTVRPWLLWQQQWYLVSLRHTSALQVLERWCSQLLLWVVV